MLDLLGKCLREETLKIIQIKLGCGAHGRGGALLGLEDSKTTAAAAVTAVVLHEIG